MDIASATKKMSFKDVVATFQKLHNADKLACGLFEDYHAKKMIVVPADKYIIKESDTKDKAVAEKIQQYLSSVDLFKVSSCFNDEQNQYYMIVCPTTDDLYIQSSNSNMYNLVIMHENCQVPFAKSLLVKKEDEAKPAFFKNCYNDHSTLLVFE